jgi:hypothetical protein
VARVARRTLGLAVGNVRLGENTISVLDWEGSEYLYGTATQKLERTVTRFERTPDAARQLQGQAQTITSGRGADMTPRIAIVIRGGGVHAVVLLCRRLSPRTLARTPKLAHP